MNAKRPTKKHAIKYLHEAMELKPNASPKQLRQESRKRLKQDGYGLGWIWVVLKILAAIAPLLFQSPKS